MVVLKTLFNWIVLSILALLINDENRQRYVSR